MDYLGLGEEDMLMERHGTWWNVSMGHMTRYLETCDRRKKEIESHGIPWKVMEG
jgi:hypothetical protein